MTQIIVFDTKATWKKDIASHVKPPSSYTKPSLPYAPPSPAKQLSPMSDNGFNKSHWDAWKDMVSEKPNFNSLLDDDDELEAQKEMQQAGAEVNFYPFQAAGGNRIQTLRSLQALREDDMRRHAQNMQGDPKDAALHAEQITSMLDGGRTRCASTPGLTLGQVCAAL